MRPALRLSPWPGVAAIVSIVGFAQLSGARQPSSGLVSWLLPASTQFLIVGFDFVRARLT